MDFVRSFLTGFEKATTARAGKPEAGMKHIAKMKQLIARNNLERNILTGAGVGLTGFGVGTGLYYLLKRKKSGLKKESNAKDLFRRLKRRGKEKTAAIIKPEIASRTEGSIHQSLAEKKGL